MTHEISETRIRSAVSRLAFKAAPQDGREFVDLNPILPDGFEPFIDYDIDRETPPEGLTQAEYDAMKPDFIVMRAAISEHDHNALEESTELFRERFWVGWGDPDLLGAKIMRRQYLSKLADRLIQILNDEGADQIKWIGWLRWGPIVVGVS